MIYLLDTNVLLRAAEPGHLMNAIAREATACLLRSRHEIKVIPQVLYEFWVVCTRPVSQNGLGFSPAKTVVELNGILAVFPLLDDKPDIFSTWKELVVSQGVSGKAAHDARIAAAMSCNGITHLLTFNDQDFRRFDSIVAVNPATVIQS